MKISPEQLKLYAVTDRSWLKPDETLASVTEELLRAGVSRDNLMKILDSATTTEQLPIWKKKKKTKACHGLSDGKNHLLYE